MPSQPQGTIVDIVLTAIALAAGALVLLAWLWHRFRDTHAHRRPPSSPPAGMTALTPEEERAVRARIAELERQQGAPAADREPALPGASIAGDWIAGLTGALHLLIIGHSRGGKTTLIHELAQRWQQAGRRVIVCDLDAARGQWPGCEVSGYANDVAAVEQALAAVSQEWERRNTLRSAGVRAFEPVYMIIDEYADVADVARELVERILRRGGKLEIHLVVGVQDKQVKTLGFEGQGDLRKNFSYVVEVKRGADGRRWATLQENGDGSAVTMPIPDLPDPESFIEPPTIDADRLLVSLFAEPQPQPRGDALNGAAEASASASTPASAAPAAPAPWADELAWICPDNGRAATKGQVIDLLRAARTEPAIVKELWQIDGTAGARYKTALDVVARIRAAALAGELIERA